jgi:hypothetical protein
MSCGRKFRLDFARVASPPRGLKDQTDDRPALVQLSAAGSASIATRWVKPRVLTRLESAVRFSCSSPTILISALLPLQMREPQHMKVLDPTCGSATDLRRRDRNASRVGVAFRQE